MSDQTEITLTESEAKHLKDTLTKIQYDAAGNAHYISRIRTDAYQAIPTRIIHKTLLRLFI
ncbi:MAG: hypothetical protein A3E81_01100 [Gammaproteobacteria bacterium RIFCSPHIGHO2_12_FULL_36_30]|nr:MAG: hypothetical protein A3E81_01100 [Gammaproteobacteria bacterium RIFCSPHIGHO2_12_FULL_36_30]